MKNLMNFANKELTKRQMNHVLGGAKFNCTCQNGSSFTIEVNDPLAFANLSDSRCGGGSVKCTNASLGFDDFTDSVLKPQI